MEEVQRTQEALCVCRQVWPPHWPGTCRLLRVSQVTLHQVPGGSTPGTQVLQVPGRSTLGTQVLQVPGGSTPGT